MPPRALHLLLLVLMAGRWTIINTVDQAPGVASPASPTTEANAELITTTTPAAQRSEAEALTETTPATTTTTTTTEATTTTTEATTTTTTSGSINLGGGLLSNSIGGGGGNGGILSLLGASTTSKPSGPKGNFDTYLDTIMVNLRKTLRTNGFDPLRLGNLLQCRNCTLEGLSLVRRAGPANLNYENRTLLVDAIIGLPAIYLTCFPCVEVVLMIPFTGMLEVALWDLQIYGKVSQKTTRGASPTLEEYRVVREGDLDMSLKGYGLLGPVAEIGFKIGVQRTISMVIRDLVYERVPALIQQQIKGFNFPIGKR